MSKETIDSFDRTGALRETAEQAAGDTRSAFLRKAALGGAGVLGSSAALTALPELASAARPRNKRKAARQDLAILNFALLLERLEAAFYDQGIASGILSGDALALAQLIVKHEEEHVKLLAGALKSKAGSTPTFDFSSALTDQTTFLNTALTLENTGVQAYLGQVANITAVPYLKVAGTIVTIEARHAAAVASLIHNEAVYTDAAPQSVTPAGSLDKPRSKAAITKAVGATGFIKE